MDIYLYCHTYVKNIRCKDVPTKRLNVKLLQFISIVQDSLNRISCESGPGVVSEFLSVSKSLLEVVMRCRAVFYI